MDEKLIYCLYRAVQWAASPLIVIYFLLRGFRDRRYFRQFGERLGFLPHSYKQTVAGAVWLHAVSVGEVLSSVTLILRLREVLPGVPVFVSTSTLAGMALAEDKLREITGGAFYAPMDYCFAVRRVLRTLRPSVLVVMETELWPNLYREAKRQGCGLLIVNGRISDRAFPRYARLRWFFRAVLSLPDRILCAGPAGGSRYLALGAPAGRIEVVGNLKYDFEPQATSVPAPVARLLEAARPETVWIAASTMPPREAGDPDEDDAVIEAFRRLAPEHPRLLLILVPRRPERFDSAAAKLAASEVPFVRRSALNESTPALRLPGVLLLDSIGELSGLFAAAGVVFMGGTLARRGGHNILEPACFGRPVICGPHMENFPDIIEEFRSKRACLEIREASELESAVGALLGDAALRADLGSRALQIAEARRGATGRALQEIGILYARALPHYRPAFPAFQFLWLLSRLWAVGGRWKRSRDLARRASLRTPVISVGSLTAGGSGKTPFVLWLAERLRAAGHSPAFLTRGYRRRNPERCTILAAGEIAPASRTGDEAQFLLRSGLGPVGIGAERVVAGRRIESEHRPSVFLLDDGFQHARLDRTLDIVLIDTLAPFGGGEMMPLGRLREPPVALERAGLIVLTRVEPGRRYDGIEAVVRRYNTEAPIFHCRTAPVEWIDCKSGERRSPEEPPCSRVVAFCGLGNPASFWRTLESLGCRPAARVAFGDHHHYRAIELRRLTAHARAAGVEALVTTEKDVMNLPADCAKWIAPLRLLFLRIGVEPEDPERLLRLVEDRIAEARGREP